ncbi:MAG: hypothetical protein Q8P24_15075 [Desulfobacterales bacterium]|nr:hypothetical protein [Desulfobacterales bacterium]
MKFKRTGPLLSLILIFIWAVPLFGAVEWNLKARIKLNAPPLDVAVSLDDQWVFILNGNGEVLVYAKDGALEGRITVGKHIDHIKVGPQENLLYLSSRERQTIEIAELDFIRRINTDSSPFQGPADAPVVVAVFNDFE